MSDKFILRTGIRLLEGGYKTEKMTGLRWPSEFNGNGWTIDPSLPHEIQIAYKYLFIEVPLAARWEFGGEKFRPFLELGIAPTFYLKTTAVQKTDIDTKKIDSENNAEGISLVHFVGLLSFGVNYELSENIQLFGQPILRGHLTPLVYNVRVKEFMYNAGIEVGIRKRLN